MDVRPNQALSSTPADALPPARFFSRRLVWHTLGLVLAALVAWLVWRGYRQPEFLLDFTNLRLC